MTTFINDGQADDGILGSTQSRDHNGVIGRNEDTTARNAATPEGNGVFGTTKVPDGAGLFGLHEGNGVGVAGFGLPAGIGVAGISAPAGAKGGDGVLGVSNSEHRNGVVGRNDSTAARNGTDPGGNGVFGFTQVPDGAGVFGAHASTGIGVAGFGMIGLSGGSVAGVGVMGVSAPPGGKGGDGVQGITNSELRNGVYGRNESTSARGNGDPAGNGVFGYTTVPDGAGSLGAHGGGGHGVIGTGGFGLTGIGTVMGVWGQAQGSAWAGYFTGPVRVEGTLATRDGLTVGGDLATQGAATVAGDVVVKGALQAQGATHVAGDLRVAGDVLLEQRDIAERFAVQADVACEPGMVMVVRDDGRLEPCTRAWDPRVVGVVSGAGTLKAAITLGHTQDHRQTRCIALVGTAFCWMDADANGSIEVGDLVTTSTLPGHAMRCGRSSGRVGTILGKALAPLASGRGLVPMLLALQ